MQRRRDVATKPWHEALELPRDGNMMFSGSPEHRAEFIALGERMFGELEAEALAHFGELRPGLTMLDFGCGVGRIALPFFHHHGLPTAASDTNRKAIEFIARALPTVHAVANGPLPPLPFADETFDCVYSVSVWTHLPPYMQWPWLREMNRILKHGGLALITTASFKALAMRKRHPKILGWHGVSEDDLRLEGMIWKRATASLPGNPNSGPDFGYVLHDPDWVAKEWGRLFDYRGVRISGIAGMQDLHVMVKRRSVGPSDLTELLDDAAPPCPGGARPS